MVPSRDEETRAGTGAISPAGSVGTVGTVAIVFTGIDVASGVRLWFTYTMW